MSLTEHDPPKHRLSRKLLLAAIVVVALVTAAVAIYAMIERPGTRTQTPAGIDYRPSTAKPAP